MKTPLVAWATASIDDNGVLQKFIFDHPEAEVFRARVEHSLRAWRFAPARKGGEPVRAELRVPFVMDQVYEPDIPGVPPKLLSKLKPVYPAAMRNSGLIGEVTVQFIVDENGAVVNPVIFRSSNPGFNEAAIDAVCRLKFEPARKGGRPIKGRLQQPMVFEFDDDPGEALFTVRPPPGARALPEELQYDKPPQPRGVFQPVYPYALLSENVNGKASVAFLVNADGQISELKVLEETKPEFGLAMMAAIEGFSFTPALKNGQPTNALLKLQKEFISTGDRSIVPAKDRSLSDLEKTHSEQILSAKALDVPLKPISRRSPNFPLLLKKRFSQGWATVEVLIDKEGKVRLPRIVEATDPAFGYAAVQAISEWRFDPPKVGRKPVIVRVQVPFVFELKDEDGASVPGDKTPDAATAAPK